MSQKKLKKLKKLDVKEKEVLVVDKSLNILGILKKNWKFLILLIFGIFALYFNSLNGDFVSDDYASITQETTIKDINVAISSLSLPRLSNCILANMFGTSSPVAYHALNLILYILICVAAFVFLSLFFDRIIAYISVILFASLPVHVEAVSWISGRPYLFVALFILFGLTSLILYTRTKKRKYLVYLLISIGFLLWTDRIRGFGIVLLAGLIFISFGENFRIKLNLTTILALLLTAFGLLLVLSWGMINNRINSVNSGTNISESIFYNPFFQYPTAITKYLQLIFFPSDLTLYHTLYITPWWLNWLVVLVYVSSVIWFYFKDKKIFFALAFIFVATAPSMAPVKVSWLVAERYVFLGSLGFCLMLAIFLERIYRKNNFLALGIVAILVSVYGVRVFLRNIDWRTNHNLWVNTCQVSPNSHNAWNNIGDDYDKLGQYENAVKGFTQSTIVKTNYADAFHNRANIFYKMGRYDLARDSYQMAINLNPSLYQSYMSLIQIDLTEKRYDLALEHVATMQKARPNDLQVVYVSAIVYSQAGKVEEAKKLLNQILQYYPQFTQAQELLNQLNNSNGSIKSN